MGDLITTDCTPVLMELRRAVHDAQYPTQWPDAADWRCSRPLNVVRAYALLIRVASKIVLESVDLAGDERRGARRGGQASAETNIVRLLKAFPSAIAKGVSALGDRGLAKALRQAEEVIDTGLPAFPRELRGAFLGAEWRHPVPSTVKAMLSEMASPTTPDERALSLTKVLAKGLSGVAAEHLDEANFGIASAVLLAQTYDDLPHPNVPVQEDRAYLQAAVVRALSAHRILLETVGVRDQLTVCSLIGLAERLAEPPRLPSDSSKSFQERVALASTRQRSLSILEEEGRIARLQKSREVFALVGASERAILAAFRVELGHDG